MTNLIKYFIAIAVIFLSFGCPAEKKGKEKIVLLTTDYGKIKIKLYNETPLHRDNFIKLVSSKFFNDLLFHRVINEFMIQGGDPDSKNAQSGVSLGNGGPGYTIPAEFNDKLYHKKGALAAARTGDNSNPTKASSGSQFYIVQGKLFKDEDLNSLEASINQSRKNNLIKKYIMLEKEKNFSNNESFDYQSVLETANKYAEEESKKLIPFKYTEEQRNTYKTIGGTPHLDGNYTVFGEIIKGLEIIDEIAKVKADRRNRPEEDIKMTIKVIK